VHKKLGWYLDHRTANRIRIGELWKRHPELTGSQVIEKLKLGPHAPLKWVQHIMHDCRKAYAKQKASERRVERKFFNSWRSHELPLKSRSASAQRAVR